MHTQLWNQPRDEAHCLQSTGVKTPHLFPETTSPQMARDED